MSEKSELLIAAELLIKEAGISEQLLGTGVDPIPIPTYAIRRLNSAVVQANRALANKKRFAKAENE